MRSIGIDIGSLAIKIAEVQSTSQGFVLSDFIDIPLSADPTADHRLEVVDALRKISSHFGHSGVRYVFAIPQERASVRHVSFPFKERHNILRSLPSQLEDDVPFSQDDAIFDAKILRSHQANAEVLAFAVPKPTIEDVIKLASDAGIDPDVITIDVPSLSNLFENWNLPARDIPGPKAQAETGLAPQAIDEATQAEIESVPPCQVLINIGHKRTNFCVFYRNTLLTTRTLSRGGHDIAEALRKAYNLPYTEALKGLQEKGFVLTNQEGATRDQIEFSNAIIGALKPLADDLKITLLEIRSQFGVEFDQVYLSGGVSRLMNIGAFLTRELELPCNPFKILERVPKTNVNPTSALEFSGITAISVAIEALKKPRNPAINLRRMEFGKQSQSYKVFIDRWGYTLKCAAIVYALSLLYTPLRSYFAGQLTQAAQAKMTTTAKESFQLTGKNATEGKIKGFIKEKRAEIEGRRQLAELKTINSAMDVISQITDRFPGKKQITVDVKRVFLKNENLIIEFEVAQASHVSLIKNALSAIATDKKVSDRSPSISPSGGKFAGALSLKVARR